MEVMFKWGQELDGYSFEDSDLFEEDSLCSWTSDADSMSNNWRGWKKQSTNFSNVNNINIGFFSNPITPFSNSHKHTERLEILSLVELSAKAVASHIPFELVEKFYSPIPEQLQLRIAFWSFPDNEDDIRLYSCLANGNSDEFVRGEVHYKNNTLSEVLQIGFHLSGTVTPNQFGSNKASVCNVAVTFDRKHITSCMCTCNSSAYWCSHVVALCLHRIHNAVEVCLRAPISESLSRLERDQLQKFAQYLISELPPQILPTAQRLIDELLSSQKNDINSVYGAPDPTAGPSAHEHTTWYLNEPILRENIKKTLIKFCQPSPMVFSDVNCLSASSPPAASEWQSLLRPLKGREPEGIWNLFMIIRELLRKNDPNSIPLLEILTAEILECDLILTWWYNNKATLMFGQHHHHNNHHHHNGGGGRGGMKTSTSGQMNSQANSVSMQHAASSLCDELISLWRLSALNPCLAESDRLELHTQLTSYHTLSLQKLHCRNRGQPLYGRHEMFKFSGFKPAIEACLLDWNAFFCTYTADGGSRSGSDGGSRSWRTLMMPPWVQNLMKLRCNSKSSFKAIHAKVPSCDVTNNIDLFTFPGKFNLLNNNTTSVPPVVVDYQLEVISPKVSEFADAMYFADIKKSTSEQEMKFAIAESLYSHGFMQEVIGLAKELAEEMLRNQHHKAPSIPAPPISVEIPGYKEKRKRAAAAAAAPATTASYQQLPNAMFLSNVLQENVEMHDFAFKIGVLGLQTNRPPAPTKQLEIKLVHQESELANQLKKIPLSSETLAIMRERAEVMRSGGMKGVRGDALLPITLAALLFDSLCLPATRTVLPPRNDLLTSDDVLLGFEAAVAALGMKANISEAEHPLLCEGSRRLKGDLAVNLLINYKDDPPKLAKIMDKILDKEIHQLYKSKPPWYSYLFEPTSSSSSVLTLSFSSSSVSSSSLPSISLSSSASAIISKSSTLSLTPILSSSTSSSIFNPTSSSNASIPSSLSFCLTSVKLNSNATTYTNNATTNDNNTTTNNTTDNSTTNNKNSTTTITNSTTTITSNKSKTDNMGVTNISPSTSSSSPISSTSAIVRNDDDEEGDGVMVVADVIKSGGLSASGDDNFDGGVSEDKSMNEERRNEKEIKEQDNGRRKDDGDEMYEGAVKTGGASVKDITKEISNIVFTSNPSHKNSNTSVNINRNKISNKINNYDSNKNSNSDKPCVELCEDGLVGSNVDDVKDSTILDASSIIQTHHSNPITNSTNQLNTNDKFIIKELTPTTNAIVNREVATTHDGHHTQVATTVSAALPTASLSSTIPYFATSIPNSQTSATTIHTTSITSNHTVNTNKHSSLSTTHHQLPAINSITTAYQKGTTTKHFTSNQTTITNNQNLTSTSHNTTTTTANHAVTTTANHTATNTANQTATTTTNHTATTTTNHTATTKANHTLQQQDSDSGSSFQDSSSSDSNNIPLVNKPREADSPLASHSYHNNNNNSLYNLLPYAGPVHGRITKYKGKSRIMPTLPNQPSEALAYFMFEMAKTVLVKAGGTSTSLFTQYNMPSLITNPTINNNNNNNPSTHPALHLCAFQIGLYALGINNSVSPNWLSRTYSSQATWINCQASEIGAAAIKILTQTWEGHLTPQEAATLADKVSRSRDPVMAAAAAELVLSTLVYAQALNGNEINLALNQCDNHSCDMLQRACLSIEKAAKDGGIQSDVLFGVAKRWFDMYKNTAQGLKTSNATLNLTENHKNNATSLEDTWSRNVQQQQQQQSNSYFVPMPKTNNRFPLYQRQQQLPQQQLSQHLPQQMSQQLPQQLPQHQLPQQQQQQLIYMQPMHHQQQQIPSSMAQIPFHPSQQQQQHHPQQQQHHPLQQQQQHHQSHQHHPSQQHHPSHQHHVPQQQQFLGYYPFPPSTNLSYPYYQHQPPNLRLTTPPSIIPHACLQAYNQLPGSVTLPPLQLAPAPLPAAPLQITYMGVEAGWEGDEMRRKHIQHPFYPPPPLNNFVPQPVSSIHYPLLPPPQPLQQPPQQPLQQPLQQPSQQPPQQHTQQPPQQPSQQHPQQHTQQATANNNNNKAQSFKISQQQKLDQDQNNNNKATRAANYLLAAFRVGMLALDALSIRVHDDRPTVKYSKNPPYGEDVKWLMHISMQLGSSCVQQFCTRVCTAVLSPFVLYEIEVEVVNYFKRVHWKPTFIHTLHQKCLQMFVACTQARIHHISPADHDDFVSFICTARRAFMLFPDGQSQFNDLLNNIRRGKSCKKDLWQRIITALNNAT